MGYRKFERLNGSGDISVVEAGHTDNIIAMDWFIAVEGLSDTSIAVEPSETRIDVYHALDGKLHQLYVESPTEAGAMMEYNPVDAMRELLAEVGLQFDDDGNFHVEESVVAAALDLKAIEPAVEANRVEKFDNIYDLESAIMDYFEDREWD